jgi:hypothetical protein
MSMSAEPSAFCCGGSHETLALPETLLVVGTVVGATAGVAVGVVAGVAADGAAGAELDEATVAAAVVEEFLDVRSQPPSSNEAAIMQSPAFARIPIRNLQSWFHSRLRAC